MPRLHDIRFRTFDPNRVSASVDLHAELGGNETQVSLAISVEARRGVIVVEGDAFLDVVGLAGQSWLPRRTSRVSFDSSPPRWAI